MSYSGGILNWNKFLFSLVSHVNIGDIIYTQELFIDICTIVGNKTLRFVERHLTMGYP